MMIRGKERAQETITELAFKSLPLRFSLNIIAKSSEIFYMGLKNAPPHKKE